MTPEEKARQEIDAQLRASGYATNINLQRASRLRQSILQEAFMGQL
jgi:hypothetical protein